MRADRGKMMYLGHELIVKLAGQPSVRRWGTSFTCKGQGGRYRQPRLKSHSYAQAGRGKLFLSITIGAWGMLTRG